MSRSGFTSSTVRITSSNDVTSPRITGAPIGTSPKVAAPGFRSMPTTDSPRATSRLMSRGPMNPVAPTTSTGMSGLSRSATASPRRFRALGGMGGHFWAPHLCVRHSRGLPRDHPPVVARFRVDGEVADGEALLLAGVFHVHVRHAVDDADAPVHARPSITRCDTAIVRLAGFEVRDVLGLRLEPGGGMHVGEIVGERRVERGPVALPHRLEAAVVGAENVVGLSRGSSSRPATLTSFCRLRRPAGGAWSLSRLRQLVYDTSPT